MKIRHPKTIIGKMCLILAIVLAFTALFAGAWLHYLLVGFCLILYLVDDERERTSRQEIEQ